MTDVIENAPAAPAAAAAPQAPAQSAQAPAAPASQDWTASLPEASKLYVQNKGFKDPAMVLESYQNFEKLMGAPKDRILKLPDKPDAPEWNEIYDKLGRPKEASEYKFAAPQGVEVNKEFTEWAQKLFHGAGLTKAQGETIAAKWNEFAQGDLKKQEEARVANIKVEDVALRREWGAAYDQQLKSCGKAADMLGFGEKEMGKLESAFGYAGALKILSSIGSKLGEDSFVDGDSAGSGFKGALTPETAKAQIAELRQDSDFVRRYTSGDRDAKVKMEMLHKFAYPDQP